MSLANPAVSFLVTYAMGSSCSRAQFLLFWPCGATSAFIFYFSDSKYAGLVSSPELTYVALMRFCDSSLFMTLMRLGCHRHGGTVMITRYLITMHAYYLLRGSHIS